MASRFARAVLAAGGIALAVTASSVSLAGPAAAVDAPPLPGKIVVKAGQTVTVTLATPAPYVCATDWTTRVAGQRKVVNEVSVAACDEAGTATWTVMVANVRKGTAVVKFIATLADGTRTVKSLIVKVKAPRPAGSSSGSSSSSGSGSSAVSLG